MKIFIIGISQTGKSTTAKYIANKYNMEYIQASIMIRNSFKKENEFNSRQEFIEAITKYSIELNQNSPMIVSKYIKENYDLNNVIIEGIRNPNNFFDLYEIKKDKIIVLDYLNNPIKETTFEKGINIIVDYLKWNIEHNIISSDDLQILRYENYNEIQGILNEKSLFN